MVVAIFASWGEGKMIVLGFVNIPAPPGWMVAAQPMALISSGLCESALRTSRCFLTIMAPCLREPFVIDKIWVCEVTCSGR